MSSSLRALRPAARIGCWARRRAVAAQRPWARCASGAARQSPLRRAGNAVGFAAVFAAAAAGAYYYPQAKALATDGPGEAEPPKVELRFEKRRRQPVSKEDNRELISSQHLQVKKSWEHPGVYAWGSNTGKVIDPGSNDRYVKHPRRIAFFNDQLLRDLKLTQSFGAAIAENGDLVQWGLGFSDADATPKATLTGKDLVKLAVSADRVIALSRKGAVYSVPCARADQQDGVKANRSSSWSLWNSGGKETINFRNLTPTSLGRGERVVDVSSGLEHCLMLTNKGRVFSAASNATSFPSKGQMGIPGLSWETRPPGAYDQAHLVTALKGFQMDRIATGDYHSVVLDRVGRVFSFGDNTFGQLGLETETRLPYVSQPSMVSTDRLYRGSGLVPKVTSIAAGGTNTFFTVDADADADAPGTAREARDVGPAKKMPRKVSDVWACGQGVSGTLGTGKWTHVSPAPTRVKALSSLYEFDEKANKMVPIRLKWLSVGTTHCAAVMDNVTETTISAGATEKETTWGADVMFWGGNEHYQLGTGRRSNTNAPTCIGPLDGGEGDAQNGRRATHRLCLTPRQTARLGAGGRGRRATLEQRVECGSFVTGVYSAV